MSRFEEVTTNIPRWKPAGGAHPQFPVPSDGSGVPPPSPLGGGPRRISFNPLQAMTGGGGSNMTLAALMKRQQELAQQRDGQMQPIQSWTQGASHMLDKFLGGYERGATDRRLDEGNAMQAGVLASMDPETGAIPDAGLDQLADWNPELWMKLVEDREGRRRWEAERTNAEKYSILTPEEETSLGLDPAGTYQRSSTDQKISKIGGEGTNITVTPPSAELGGKLGLAKGFTDNYDAIIASAEAGEMTGGGYISSVQFGRGPGGIAYRNLRQGTEAMIRILTGAGMSESEAADRVTQYEPAITDDATTLVAKIKGLKQAIDNVEQGVRDRGQGEEEPAPDDTSPTPDQRFEVGNVYTFRQGKAKYLGGEIGSPESWEVVP